jgi:transcriptional regulator GlxA family with amidase domain
MDYRIKKLLIEIEDNFSHPLNVHELAESVNLSVYHLQHLFKKEVGTSITKYINNLRLQKARKCLETTNMSIREIRLKIGSSNETLFFRDFKQKFGATPIEYRKSFANSRIRQ